MIECVPRREGLYSQKFARAKTRLLHDEILFEKQPIMARQRNLPSRETVARQGCGTHLKGPRWAWHSGA
jgi:hypothetical protein